MTWRSRPSRRGGLGCRYALCLRTMRDSRCSRSFHIRSNSFLRWRSGSLGVFSSLLPLTTVGIAGRSIVPPPAACVRRCACVWDPLRASRRRVNPPKKEVDRFLPIELVQSSQNPLLFSAGFFLLQDSEKYVNWIQSLQDKTRWRMVFPTVWPFTVSGRLSYLTIT